MKQRPGGQQWTQVYQAEVTGPLGRGSENHVLKGGSSPGGPIQAPTAAVQGKMISSSCAKLDGFPVHHPHVL